jgi:hypothetical protein
VRTIFLSIPYSGDKARSCRIAAQAQRHAYDHCAPCVVLAPQLCLAASFDEDTERERCMAACLDMVRAATEVWWWGTDDGTITDGVAREIAAATEANVPLYAGPWVVLGRDVP